MPTLHLVSHTHWDREWYLTFQQFRLKLVHLIDGLLDLLERDPDYKFFMLDGQTIVLEDYLLMRPGQEEVLRRHIQTGRILVGPWYILPDEFLVSPESIIRNLLQGDRTARRFGPKMMVGYTPDPFGHLGQMPQILSAFGIDAACVQRGLADEPAEFWWQAPDGSRVLMAYLRDGYGNAAGLPTSNPNLFVQEVANLRAALLPYTAADEILLMHGTDHMEPPGDTSAAILAAQGKLGGDKLVHSTLPAYLEAVKKDLSGKDLPIITGELRSPKRHHLLPGVLSTRMWIKQRNQTCETLLEKWAEPFSTFASLTGPGGGPQGSLRRPAAILREAWRLLLECHPHDSICGCSIDQVHAEMRPRFDQVEQIGEEITKQSLERLAECIATTPMEIQRSSNSMPEKNDASTKNPISAVVVFNPSGSMRSEAVSATFKMPAGVNEFDLADESGILLPYQRHGLGTREIINMSLNPKEFQAAFGQVNEGRAAGMTVQDLQVLRDESIVSIEAAMAEGGEPDLAAWKKGLQVIQGLLADPGVTTYNVHVQSASEIQITFKAPDVPAFGYRTFWVYGQPGRSQPVRLNTLTRAFIPLGARLAGSPLGKRLLGSLGRQPFGKAASKIENDTFLVKVAKDGTLSLLDKRTGAVFQGLNRFVDGGDCGDEYDYAPPPSDRWTTARLKGARLQRGPVRQTLEVRLELKVPLELAADRKSRTPRAVTLPVTTRVTLIDGVERVDIQTEVDNRARDHRLRVHFPAPFAAQAGDYDGSFEVVRRPIGLPAFDETWVEQPRPEVPQRAFTDISDGNLGLMLANRGLPEVEVLKNEQGNAEIALTLLRCVGWLSRQDFSTRSGHAGPMLETPGAQMPGRWTFEYAILPHRGGWQTTFQQAFAFETPLRAVCTAVHAGELSGHGSFLEISPASFVVSAIKEAEVGRGWIVRGYNICAQEIQATMKPWRRFKHVERVNLGEEGASSLAAAADGGVSIRAKAHEIVTVMFAE